MPRTLWQIAFRIGAVTGAALGVMGCEIDLIAPETGFEPTAEAVAAPFPSLLAAGDLADAGSPATAPETPGDLAAAAAVLDARAGGLAGPVVDVSGTQARAADLSARGSALAGPVIPPQEAERLRRSLEPGG